MEYIEGGRVDDKEYLAEHHIDRNKVALELSHIFSRMVHLNGWFHAVSDMSHQSAVRVFRQDIFRTLILVNRPYDVNISRSLFHRQSLDPTIPPKIQVPIQFRDCDVGPRSAF
jgi:ABC1 atypical kinase-like domain